MVRWAVVATAPGGLSTREPDPQAKEGDYKGTVIPGPLPVNSLPVLYWFAEDPVAAQSVAGARSSLALNGSFYDDVEGQRRGVTSLNYPKPKMKFKANSGKQFDLFPNAPRMGQLKLNSLYFELGELSFMKEYVASRVRSTFSFDFV
ncbi:hypothetical protein MNEG_4702 [Monoraphidium neglectum]|uniref:Uncharacterized protein n=1 Tax=Monoraphidium neglectum TaxID=145388 RepID=A0A0D2MS88_9CHLO|nr:hypothetical protein MNEG_4702 [Monoraphidium neglectum]KIZ03262.1 hypothetical protein MNEG_4702 [Monoraphidium neglectum]|eukprot:XP_013902281.1 hypothetical protein MNEG_4702 [Monoraphidium neglectum]